jgi:UDP-N-acetylmuramyl pentapeptide phosphotransferase/UDP-N-acetylglucosamine-1-phosphate transferase
VGLGSLLLLSLLVAALSFVWVERTRRWALVHLLDRPNARSSHTVPTPRGGGLGLVAAALTGLALFATLDADAPASLASLGALTGAMAALGFLDDRRPLPARLRLVAQLALACLSVALLGSLSTWELKPSLSLPLGALGPALTVVWLVGLTNAYNFMDGIDGIAGLAGAVAGAGWALVGVTSGSADVALLGALVGASALGFLGLNWPPARIFMGDVGSTFLGLWLALVPLFFAGRVPEVAGRAPTLGFLLVWPFVCDASFTFVRRALRRENVFAAHRTHLYQRLVIAGLSHRTVTLVYGGLAALGALFAQLVLAGALSSLAALALVAASFVALVVATRSVERSVVASRS